MRWSIKAALLGMAFSVILRAGPVDFGMGEVNAALASRNLKWKVRYELTLDPPETYRIEPYVKGGAIVTGGDLKGLMYGLLDAADQIHATGRLKQVHAVPAAPARGVRTLSHASDLERPQFYWQAYFQRLARDRFDRFTLVLAEPPANLEKLRAISQMAAEYGLDFTVGLRDPDPALLSKVLSACPLIRNVQIRSDVIEKGVLNVLREAGRRVALDPLGSPAFAKAARDAGVALHDSPECWPPCFELDPPGEFQEHTLFYWVWGRVAYDPKLKAPDGQSVDEFHAAAQITALLAAAQEADPTMIIVPQSAGAASEVRFNDSQPHDFIASIQEAVRDRMERIASAKRTPLENADLLLAAAGALDKTATPDFRLLARLARYHAHRERALYLLELARESKDAIVLDQARQEAKDAQVYFELRLPDIPAPEGPASPLPPLPKPLPSPRFIHQAVKTASSGQPVTLTLQIGSVKDTRTVRLHYRAVEPAGAPVILEKPAAASVSFTIPTSDLPPAGQLLYYFEILNRENGGWFELDPAAVAPYHLLKIEPK